ncbi:MAG TPA: PilW family protein [Burkholderiaceae bacterium]|nr:PilW family protein [Burkholderiaceae bacterium]
MRAALVLRRQRGRTLIELLVAITIGMMLSVGILSIYGANRQTYRASTDLQHMQAAGQLALDRLAYQIRMAGYGQIVGDFTTVSTPTSFTGNPLWACSGGFNSPVDPSQTPACTGDATQPDAVQIRYQVENAAVAGSGESRDCLGFAVPVDGTGVRTAQNRFYIATSNGVPTLMCAGNSLAPAPLIPNVEDLQVRLRVGDPFSRAQQVVDPAGFTDWGRVIGVELCVQVVSENLGENTQATQTGTSCRGGAFPADGRLRRTFTQAITLRNRIL